MLKLRLKCSVCPLYVLQEMHQLQTQQAGTVNVEVDSPDSTDLTKVLEEMREQYETLMKNNKLELEKWYQSKVRCPFSRASFSECKKYYKKRH